MWRILSDSQTQLMVPHKTDRFSFPASRNSIEHPTGGRARCLPREFYAFRTLYLVKNYTCMHLIHFQSERRMVKYNGKFRRIAEIMLEANLVSTRMIYSGSCDGALARNHEIIPLM